MPPHRIAFYQPGHFHAALTLRNANPRLANDIHVYAGESPERDAFTGLIKHFSKRSEQPTQWQLHLHNGPDLQERLIADGHVDAVILAGQNHTKLETIDRFTQAGLHVLADKPWLTDSRQLPFLDRVTTGPQLAMDIMTIRHSIIARLCHQVVDTPALFGGFIDTGADPAVDIGSVHHIYKMVNGRPLKRPPWYYDIEVQGDGMVDVQSHMAEQAQWWVLGDAVGDFERDAVLDSARRWTTPVPPDLFQDSTGLSAYPEAIRPWVQEGVQHYACNGEIRYRLRGIRVRQTTEWRAREPEGGGDLHSVTLRGRQVSVIVRQGPETGYQAELHLEPVAGVDVEPMLKNAIGQWQDRFPGLSVAPSDLGFRLVIPPGLDHGHESHFPLVLDTFLDHLDQGEWPESLRARIRMRYTLLARAREMALGQ
ncbi:putative oxidoreductase C-terminal domain-containing protein [Candidatus Entotheonella palauensis]|uniref:putative oxidoreductase C-terminal domain-containing protein n=1 Tax=Candidatus Entotheonella palauensis TaxID=93172 RepID=UPI000B7E59AA|nr:putative oxidoreductase C-terminal domain-containing protein [Candidatus Entotheonella palauensis]